MDTSETGRGQRSIGSEKKIILKNFIVSSGSHVIGFFLLFAVNIINARYLGPSLYGDFSFLFAIWTIILYFVESGVAPLLIREINTSHRSLQTILAEFDSAIWIAALIGFFLLLIITFLIAPGKMHIIKGAFFCGVCLIIVLHATCFGAFFRAKEDMEYNAVGFIIHKITLFAAILAVIYMDLGFIGVISAYVASNMVLFLFYSFFLHYRYKLRLPLSFNLKRSLFILKEIAPLGFGTLCRRSAFQMEIMLLHVFHSPEGAGLYSAVLKLPQVIQQFSQVTAVTFFPALNRRCHDTGAFRLFFIKILTVAILLGIIVMFPLWFLADTIIITFFGQAYVQALPVFKVLIFTVPFTVVVPVLFFALTARKAEKSWLLVNFFTLLWNIVAAIVFIMALGLLGGGFSRLSAEVFLSVCLIFIILRSLKITAGKPPAAKSDQAS
jgi:O-antigen/teichoic acid export membrane protein